MSDPAPSAVLVVALGSNLGDSIPIMAAAVAELEKELGVAARRSSVWSSTPQDCPPDSPPFCNAVVSFPLLPGLLSPVDLLDRLQEIERQSGRRPKAVMNEPRPLDLDLIVYGDLRLSHERLVLPHPRATQRLFVLQPLLEIEPSLRFPGIDQSLSQLTETLAKDPNLRRLGPLRL